jgi:hypothetical protein
MKKLKINIMVYKKVYSNIFAKEGGDEVLHKTLLKSWNSPDGISFVAPWGEAMVLQPGDYLVKSDGGYYRIEREAFRTTYKILRT